MIAKVDKINDNRPDIDNEKLYGRFFSNIENVKKYLNYGDLAGNTMLDEAIEKAKKIYNFKSKNLLEEKF